MKKIFLLGLITLGLFGTLKAVDISGTVQQQNGTAASGGNAFYRCLPSAGKCMSINGNEIVIYDEDGGILLKGYIPSAGIIDENTGDVIDVSTLPETMNGTGSLIFIIEH